MYLPLLKQANDLLNLLRYVAFTLSEGDYLNDWLTHLPAGWQPVVLEIGKQLAEIL